MSSWYWIEGQGYLPHSLYEEAHKRTRDRFNIDLAMQGAQYRRGPAPPMDTAESVQSDREVKHGGPENCMESIEMQKWWACPVHGHLSQVGSHQGVGGNPR